MSDGSDDSPDSTERKGNGDKSKMRRLRMTAEQTAAMEAEWQRDLTWTSSRISSIAKRLGLGRTKVYKWTWDRKKKDGANGVPTSSNEGNTSYSMENPAITSRNTQNTMIENFRSVVAPSTTTLANRFRQEMARNESMMKREDEP